jgi:hypothetical protein
VGGKLAMKLVSFDVIALFRSGNDLPSEFSYSSFENDFRRI